MTDYRAQVRAVIAAVRFISTTRYTWFGVASPPLPASIRPALNPATARRYLLHQLQWQLYHDFYCVGGAAPAAPAAGSSDGATFAEQLAAANSGQGAWVPAAPERAGTVAVQWDGLLWRAPLADCRPDPATGVPYLRLPRHLLGISPGFYMALSDTPLAAGGPLLRLYWHVEAAGAPHLLALTTEALNRAALPFKLKVLNDPAHFTRCDAAVLYVRPTDYPAVAAIVHRLYPLVSAQLCPRPPALTRLLAPGLGLAEDPGGGDSFGLHRCRLLAEGLLRAHETGQTTPAACLDHIIQTWAAVGLELDQPFLQSGLRDMYSNIHSISMSPGPIAPTEDATVGAEAVACLVVAEMLGRRLVADAIWYEDQCNWIGATRPEQANRGATGIVYQALGGDLYAGTSGVALFLAELGAVSSDPALRGTALGAMRQAFAWAPRLPAPARLGLYTGWVGLALAAWRVGRLLAEESLLAQARTLLRTLHRDYVVREFDLLAGSAGAIVGLLTLGAAWADTELQQFAAELGVGLLAAGRKAGSGISWPSPTWTRPGPHLTGLAHGAGGIGYALLELYAATGEAAYRTAAEQAFAYEASWFDPAAGNWADLRFAGRRARRANRQAFATYWCHGAPGITLTRLRADQLLGDPQCRAEAIIGLATTHAGVEAMLTGGRHNFSLCHGLAGNAEIARIGARLLPQSAAPGDQIARQVAQFGIARYGAPGRSWPGGEPGTEPPGLLLGLAGIGLFYLGMARPTTTPSILLVRPGMYD